MYREQLGEQLGYVSLDITYDCGTGLRNAAEIIIFLDIVNVCPCSDISTEGNTDDAVNAELLEPAEYSLILSRIVCSESRCHKDRNLFTLLQVFEESLGIVAILSRVMLTCLKAGAASDTFGSVDIYSGYTVLVLLGCDTGTEAAADPDTSVAADAIVIGKNQGICFYFHHVLLIHALKYSASDERFHHRILLVNRIITQVHKNVKYFLNFSYTIVSNSMLHILCCKSPNQLLG